MEKEKELLTKLEEKAENVSNLIERLNQLLQRYLDKPVTPSYKEFALWRMKTIESLVGSLNNLNKLYLDYTLNILKYQNENRDSINIENLWKEIAKGNSQIDLEDHNHS